MGWTGPHGVRKNTQTRPATKFSFKSLILLVSALGFELLTPRFVVLVLVGTQQGGPARSPLDYFADQSIAWRQTPGGKAALLRGTEKLTEAVAAYRAALEERTRERVPLDWARAQNNLGIALERLGARESGTEKLTEAVAAYRAALEEDTRERVPLDWAMTQSNLGNALETLGARESGTEKLTEAVAAYRAALEEDTRERVPLDWAMTQSNLGNALEALGARESGTEKLTEAVAAYRAALEEYTDPRQYELTMNNLDRALTALKQKSREQCGNSVNCAALPGNSGSKP
jgi:tetratricopeptide (TPR) repeat protein